MPVFTWVPSYEPELKMEPKFLEANFGDGYSQIIPNGINNMQEVWEVRFNNRSKEEVTDIDNFLRAVNGSPFDWQNPDGVVIKTYCKSWRKSRAGFGAYMLSATFNQWFGA